MANQRDDSSDEIKAVDGSSASDTDSNEPTMEEILSSIRRIISTQDEARSPVNAENDSGTSRFSGAQDNVQDNVITLTSVVNDDGRITTIAEEPLTASPDPNPQADIKPNQDQPKIESPSFSSEHSFAAESLEDSLIARDVATSVESAFDRLTRSMRGEDSPPPPLSTPLPPIGGRTVEDLARELLRPLLKEWLDAWLPDTVERIVREEIARLTRR